MLLQLFRIISFETAARSRDIFSSLEVEKQVWGAQEHLKGYAKELVGLNCSLVTRCSRRGDSELDQILELMQNHRTEEEIRPLQNHGANTTLSINPTPVPAGSNAYSDLVTGSASLGLFLAKLGRNGNSSSVSMKFVPPGDKNPEIWVPSLAQSLTSLGLLLSELGRNHEAVIASQESISLFRDLNHNTRASKDYSEMLVGSLMHHAGHLLKIGRHEDVVFAVQEAAELLCDPKKKSSKQHPSKLIDSYRHLENQLSKLERHEDAVATIQEAAGLLCDFRKKSSGKYTWELVGQYGRLADQLYKLRRQKGAVVAREMLWDLEKKHPGQYT